MRYAYFLVRVGLLAVVVGCIGSLGCTLFQEYKSLREAKAGEEHSRVVGYEGITPSPSFAKRPEEWFRREGGTCWLWSGWRPSLGHGWFRVEAGSINPARLSGFLGRDAIRAVDKSIFEREGGRHWSLIPDSAEVYSLESSETDTAYPYVVLEKVGIVNATIDKSPFLIVFTPWVPQDQAVTVYDPRLKSGSRVRMGSTGYFLDGRPLLYDRDTESLWVRGADGLEGITGPRRGHRLPLAASPRLCSWSSWKSTHPEGRVLVGADRSSEEKLTSTHMSKDLARNH